MQKLPVTLALLGCLALAGCSATSVDVESRDIALQPDVEPASYGGAAGITPALLQKAGPSYVTLTVSRVFDQTTGTEKNEKQALSSGSGFVVGTDGVVVTAAHVAIKPGYAVQARAADGRIYTGKVLAVRPDNDMAIIKLRGFRGHAAEPAGTACLARGATVFSLGKPHAQGDTARIGQLEAMSFGRPVRYGNFGYPDAMVLQMSTQRGESGGPLFDERGELVGMVVSTLADANGRSINLAHALSLAPLSQYLCENTQCSPQWSVLASQSGVRCSSS